MINTTVLRHGILSVDKLACCLTFSDSYPSTSSQQVTFRNQFEAFSSLEVLWYYVQSDPVAKNNFSKKINALSLSNAINAVFKRLYAISHLFK